MLPPRLLVACLCVACGSSPAPPTARSPSATSNAAGSRPEPLATLCARSPDACLPFTQASAATESCGTSKRCTVANVGACGAGTFIETVENFSDTVRHYGATGALVSSCSGNIEHGGTICFGERPSCTMQVEKQFGSSS